MGIVHPLGEIAAFFHIHQGGGEQTDGAGDGSDQEYGQHYRQHHADKGPDQCGGEGFVGFCVCRLGGGTGHLIGTI